LERRGEARLDWKSLSGEHHQRPADCAEELAGEQWIDGCFEACSDVVEEGGAAGGDAGLEVDRDVRFADVEAGQAVAEDDAEPGGATDSWIDEDLECSWVLNGGVVVWDPSEKPVADFAIFSEGADDWKVMGEGYLVGSDESGRVRQHS
jgi:hypothetical protein